MLPVLLPLLVLGCCLLSSNHEWQSNLFHNGFREDEIDKTPRAYSSDPLPHKTTVPCPLHSHGHEKLVNVTLGIKMSSLTTNSTTGSASENPVIFWHLVAQIVWFHYRNCQAEIQATRSLETSQRLLCSASVGGAGLYDRRFVTNRRSGHSQKVQQFANHSS